LREAKPDGAKRVVSLLRAPAIRGCLCRESAERNGDILRWREVSQDAKRLDIVFKRACVGAAGNLLAKVWH
jgi:hypothetical protein